MELDDPKEKIKYGIKEWNWTIPRKIKDGTGQPQEKISPEFKKLDDPQGSVTQEYAPIGGEADFCRESAKLAFGDTSPVITNGLNVTVQVTAGPSARNPVECIRRRDPESYWSNLQLPNSEPFFLNLTESRDNFKLYRYRSIN
jgi:aspartate/tyrosine/aromatic aminotransferase